MEKLLHPEHFKEKRQSILKRLREKKAEVRERTRKDLVKEKAKDVPHL